MVYPITLFLHLYKIKPAFCGSVPKKVLTVLMATNSKCTKFTKTKTTGQKENSFIVCIMIRQASYGSVLIKVCTDSMKKKISLFPFLSNCRKSTGFRLTLQEDYGSYQERHCTDTHPLLIHWMNTPV